MKQLSWLSGKRGLMVHYLPEFPGNEQVDRSTWPVFWTTSTGAPPTT